jgi:lambda repressor-like predicted transcriptional regulator
MNLKTYTREMLTSRFPEETSLQTVFRQLEADLHPTGEVVCHFKINGMSLTEEAEQRLAQVNLQEVQTIEVGSQNPGQILESILSTWALRIPSIIEKNDELSKKIRFDGVEGAMKMFVELIDDCQLLIDSIISINSLFPHMQGVQSEVWKKAESLIADGIGQSLQAFEKKDYTLLADVLEYDLGHALQSWLEILAVLETNVQNLKRAGSPIEDYLSSQQSQGKEPSRLED